MKVMKKWQFTLGFDVSKLTLDVSCSELKAHLKTSNDAQGFKQFLKWCKTHGIALSKSFVVLEYTGGYEYKLLQFLESKSIQYARLPGLSVKNSGGIARGKTDKVDSQRLAQYGEEKHKTLSASKPLNPVMIRLKELLSCRKRLVRDNAGYQSSLKERAHMYGENKKDIIVVTYNKNIAQNKKSISAIEKELQQIISQDAELLLSYTLITSIKGIGKINALMTIAYTENFSSFVNARSYAVYVGVVPFEHSSGTSIHKRKRVSNLANKELKQELNQAAKTAIEWDAELKEYAQRLSKTKHYKIILNNVKFKLILRMFSLVKRGEMFVENYKKAA